MSGHYEDEREKERFIEPITRPAGERMVPTKRQPLLQPHVNRPVRYRNGGNGR